MTTSLETFGTLEYVLDKYSKIWCWKVTGEHAVAMISNYLLKLGMVKLSMR